MEKRKVTAEEVARVYAILKEQFELRRTRLREIEGMEARAVQEQPAEKEDEDA